jgi:hypothetical protein
MGRNLTRAGKNQNREGSPPQGLSEARRGKFRVIICIQNCFPNTILMKNR